MRKKAAWQCSAAFFVRSMVYAATKSVAKKHHFAAKLRADCLQA
jgi:hypothetical protein